MALVASSPACAPTVGGAIGSQEDLGLRMVADEAERELRRSGQVVRDPPLEAYVREVSCRVAGPSCPELRIVLLDRAEFNAAAWPNGLVELWTGALLRCENEAQLALLLGHEIAHYEERHAVRRWQRAQATLGVAGLLGTLIGAPALAELTAALDVLAYSREQEYEADRLGLAKVAAAGYDAGEAPRLWENLVAERAASATPDALLFLRTHPTDAQRLDAIRATARGLPVPPGPDAAGRAAFAAIVRGRRRAWLEAELDRRAFGESEVLIARLLAADPHAAELRFAAGELHRLRARPGDLDRAIEHYRAAIVLRVAPAETWRSLGVVLARLGRAGEAREAFGTYLATAPDAWDRAMVERMLHAAGP